ncbi:hypothetical protein BKE30_12690 [Alkanindiges hydrocarboniclasticus]|uniref:Uncharacterized protein n=1 Tax=Alkanindiges hydrocarboniclasticus TaxID=1907941 RepID=A0A1S8CRD7_9GAMM|nr:hypothetical protein [Alkanindiges hydrocarboniclasticus]ONG38364.1 hypothetical protein BKE30_12690 [Alkanindiges hydrocarboniclasticus]
MPAGLAAGKITASRQVSCNPVQHYSDEFLKKPMGYGNFPCWAKGLNRGKLISLLTTFYLNL